MTPLTSGVHSAQGLFCRLANGPRQLTSVQHAIEKKLPTVLTHLDGKPFNPNNNMTLTLESLIKKDKSALKGAYLDGIRTGFINLKNTILDRIELNHARLNGANLNDASLNDASLNDASLYGASLRGANLNDASLHGASLRGANLNHTSLYRANLNYASLNDASLHGVDLTQSKISNSSLVRAELSNVNLNGAVLKGNNFTQAKFKTVDLGFLNTSHHHPNPTLNPEDGNNFTESTFQDVDVTMAHLPYSNFTQAQWIASTKGEGFIGSDGNFQYSRVSSNAPVPASVQKAHLFDHTRINA
jgi:uncharacterized protein YjbI with pentapeptide repeats